MFMIIHCPPLTQSLGTPEEDAYRRDFTVNALFFNINTQSVEDLVKTV
jgi:tRNA nucleotidyltransferase/poly(A) polymerase